MPQPTRALGGNDPFNELLSQVAQLHFQQIHELQRINAERLDRLSFEDMQPRVPSEWESTVLHSNICEKETSMPSRAGSKSPSVAARSEQASDDPRCKLQAREIWEERVASRRLRSAMLGRKTSKTMITSYASTDSFTKYRDDEQWKDKVGARVFFSSILLTPSNPKRMLWDIFGMMLLAYDVVVIPLGAFFAESTPFLDIMEWVTLLFWTGDIVMSLITGFISEGVLVMIPEKIFVNYIKTWFILDLIVVGPDWTFTILMLVSAGDEDVGGSGNVSKLFRSLRMVRTMRLLRIVKLKRIIAMAKDMITSEFVFIVLNILKLIVMLLLVNHFIAAAWYSIGKSVSSPNWVDEHGFTNSDAGYAYLTSLHWSLTQFTPGSMHVQPVNSLERIFALTVLVSGLVLFAGFISSVTASLTQLRAMQDDKAKQFWLLRRYLSQRNVPMALSYKILRYIEYALKGAQDMVPESRVTVLSALTAQLRDELRYVTSFTCMKSHAVFHYLAWTQESLMHRMTRLVLSEQSYASDDPVIAPREPGDHMFWVLHGAITYISDHVDGQEGVGGLDFNGFVGVPSEGSDICHTLSHEDYLCEVCLWVGQYAYFGSAYSKSMTRAITIEAAGFGELVSKEPSVLATTASYAREFVAWVQEISDPATIECSTGSGDHFTKNWFGDLDFNSTASLTTK